MLVEVITRAARLRTTLTNAKAVRPAEEKSGSSNGKIGCCQVVRFAGRSSEAIIMVGVAGLPSKQGKGNVQGVVLMRN